MNSKDWTTENLIHRCRRGEALAWKEFFRRFGPVMYGSIRTQMHRHDLGYRQDVVDDIYQSLCTHLFAGDVLQTIRKPESTKSYLRAIATTRTIDQIRLLVREHTLFTAEDDLSVVEPDSGKADWNFKMPDPRDFLILHEVREAIDKVLENLSMKEELAFRLRWQHGLKLENIATLLDEKLNTISSMIRRTLEKTKSRLDEEGFLS